MPFVNLDNIIQTNKYILSLTMAKRKFMKGQKRSHSKQKTKQFSFERSNTTRQYKKSPLTTLAVQHEQ